MSKPTLPSVAPMSQWLMPHGVPESVIVVRGTGTGITGVTISVTPRSALMTRTPVCLRIVNISNLLVNGLEEGGLQSAPPVPSRVGIPGRELGVHPRQLHGLKLEHHQRPGGVLGERLVDRESDLGHQFVRVQRDGRHELRRPFGSLERGLSRGLRRGLGRRIGTPLLP